MRLRTSILVTFTAAIALAASALFAQGEAQRFFNSVEVHRGLFLLGTSISQYFEGSTNDDAETQLTVTDPTADRTITLPNDSGTVMLADSAATSAVVGGLVAIGATNPTTVVTGLTTLTACTVNMFDTAPASNTDPFIAWVQYTSTAGQLKIYTFTTTGSATHAVGEASYLCAGQA